MPPNPELRRPDFGPKDMYAGHSDEVWTPLSPQVYALIEELHREAGTWRLFCEIVSIRPRYMRFIRHGAHNKYRRGKQKCISLMLMDRILTAFDMTHRLNDFPWYTTDQLVEMGIWEEHADIAYIAELNKEEARQRRTVEIVFPSDGDVVRDDDVKSMDVAASDADEPEN